MKEQTREDPTILAAAERQMHAWALQTELRDRAADSGGEGRSIHGTLRLVAISREAGAGGSEIALDVGQRLGWSVFDKSLLDQVASRFHLPRPMLDAVDETPTNWAYDILVTWMDHRVVPHDKYVACLRRVVRLASRSGRAVFVGRGSQFLLPRQEVLAVRLIASPKYRVEQMMARRGMNEAAARRCVEELDRDRREFVARFFHHDIADPHLYDLVLNVEQLGKPLAVAEILTAVGWQGVSAARAPA
jgi:cytidylate kinase